MKTSKSALPMNKSQDYENTPNKKDEVQADRKETNSKPEMHTDDVQQFLTLLQDPDDFDKF